ncbi:MAG: hypothetical protein KIT22_11190 [Verrucomicrobiae bacterium]|nr:hypothetical protein [Verrucomicrobiae bacterium]
MNDSTLEQAREAKAKAASALRTVAELAGIGITRIDGGYGLKVNLRRIPKNQSDLPAKIGGVPIRFEVIGSVRKQPAGA